MQTKLTLLSWNIRQGGGKRIEHQLEAISSLLPDVVALQEMTIKNVDRYVDGLKGLGFQHLLHTFENTKDLNLLTGPRKYGLLVASKFPITVANTFSIPWEERVLGVQVNSSFGCIEVYNTHIPPGSSNGWVKIDTFEGIFNKLACHSRNHRILCGDFNSPQLETKDGEVITWGQVLHKDGIWKVSSKKKRWDDGERSIFEGLVDYDLRDVFRTLFDFEKREYSFVLKRKEKLFHRRFDHCFASMGLNPVSFEYLHHFRERNFSDHSPLVVKFKPEIIVKSDLKSSNLEKYWDHKKWSK